MRVAALLQLAPNWRPYLARMVREEDVKLLRARVHIWWKVTFLQAAFRLPHVAQSATMTAVPIASMQESSHVPSDA